MRIVAWPVYVAFVAAACRAEVILDDGKPDGSAGKGGTGGGFGGVAGRGTGGAGGAFGKGGAGGSGMQGEGGVGSGGSAGTSSNDASTAGSGGSGAPSDEAGLEGSAPWPGPPPPFYQDAAAGDACASGPVADAAKVAVAAQCDAISARYDALHKSIVLAAPYFESPGVGGTYDLSYTLATTSGPQFGHSSGAITMANGWMIIDLSGAPDVDKHPIVDIAVCRITYTDVCGVIHHYSDTQFVELRGCERLNLLPNADSGVDLLPVCGGSGCGSRCLADGGLPSP